MERHGRERGTSPAAAGGGHPVKFTTVDSETSLDPPVGRAQSIDSGASFSLRAPPPLPSHRRHAAGRFSHPPRVDHDATLHSRWGRRATRQGGQPPDQLATTRRPDGAGQHYHLHLQPGEAVVAEGAGGPAPFSLGWPGPCSPTRAVYQVFSLGALNRIDDHGRCLPLPPRRRSDHLTPERSMGIQMPWGRCGDGLGPVPSL